ncbi:MAG: hypothetical protein JW778_08000 [Candidatus Altiarchaeota archaeon]|nr:hypothetical protein [Candidatus Altiarchaeota archaeon]
MRKNPTIPLLLIGFVSVIGQTLLMREFIVVFQGNELTLGLILGNWLLLTAIGSYMGGILSEKYDLKERDFAVLQVIAAIILPAQIFLTRVTRNLLGVGQGELLGLGQILGSTFLILAPICIILGFQFSLGCRIYSREKNVENIGKVYVLESAGSLIGGVLFSYLLVGYLSAFQTAFLVAILALTAAHQLLEKTERWRLGVYLFLVTLLLCFMNASSLEKLSHNLQWGADFISSEDSIYGNIAVLERSGQYSVYENGLLLYSTGDIEKNEEIHFTMLEHPSPEKVLLVGGGAGGALKEILKHPIEEVVYVELDSMILEVSRKYIPEKDLTALDDPRVMEVMGDGRLLIKESKNVYDVVIVSLPEPSTAQLNRFYTQEFFQEVESILSDDGIVSITIPSSESYVGREEGILGGSIYKTINTVFPEVIIIPGERSIILASKDIGVLTYDPRTLNNRMEDRGVKTVFLHEPYIGYTLSSDRINHTLSSISDDSNNVNTDLRPVGYYYYMLLWSSLTDETPITYGWALITASAIILLILLRHSRSPVIPLATLVVGLIGMTHEVIMLLAYQALYGYVYHKIALIIAAFMGGLAVGAFSMNQMTDRVNKRLFAGILFSMTAYTLLLPTILKAAAVFPSDFLFSLLAAASGFLVGLGFPLASKLYHLEDKGITETAGTIYASDLFGAFMGTILSSAILIPLMGITNVCILLAALSFIALTMVLIG